MNWNVRFVLFAADVIVALVVLAGAIWSVAFPGSRLWPPPGRRSWQHLLTWGGFYVVIGLTAALMVLDWNSWIVRSPLRWIVGAPLAVLGGGLALWGMVTVGWKNTSGLRGGFVLAGPYRFTRNPQYVGDIVFFTGVSVIANSAYVWIALFLLNLWFVVTPMAEEPWLDEQYGEEYRQYVGRVPRFL